MMWSCSKRFTPVVGSNFAYPGMRPTRAIETGPGNNRVILSPRPLPGARHALSTFPSITFLGRYDTTLPLPSVDEGAVWVAVTCTPSLIRCGTGVPEEGGGDDPAPPPPRAASPTPASAMPTTATTASEATHRDRIRELRGVDPEADLATGVATGRPSTTDRLSRT